MNAGVPLVLGSPPVAPFRPGPSQATLARWPHLLELRSHDLVARMLVRVAIPGIPVVGLNDGRQAAQGGMRSAQVVTQVCE